jgi:hypothetical protein
VKLEVEKQCQCQGHEQQEEGVGGRQERVGGATSRVLSWAKRRETIFSLSRKFLQHIFIGGMRYLEETD